jgi:hypothetical protein
LDNSRRAALAIIGAIALGAHAAGTIETPLRDPWVPPALQKQRRVDPPAEGAALRAEVERKLRTSFDEAARPYGGTLTREQARGAGLGFIANHFDAIDRRRAGRIGFEEYAAFLRGNGAALD